MPRGCPQRGISVAPLPRMIPNATGTAKGRSHFRWAIKRDSEKRRFA